MKCLTNFVKSIDFFGTNLSMSFLKKEKYKTFFGSFLSLALLGYLLYKFYNFTIKTINKENFTQTNNIYFEDNKINLKNYEFGFCYSNGLFNYDFLKFSDYFDVVDPKNNFEIIDCDKSNITILERYINTSIEFITKNTCLCCRPKKDIFINMDIINAEVKIYSLNIFPKAKLFDIDYSNTFIYHVNRNTYFDYNKKDNPITSYITPVVLKPQLISQQYNLSFNKIKYSEIIDFDLFYKHNTDYEDYTISENYAINAVETIKNEDKLIKPFFIFNMFATTKIYKYDITLLSLDNILATFSGVFQVLSMLLGFIGSFYNNIIFNKDIKNYFLKLEEEKDLNKILKKIYNYNKFNNYEENDIIGEISNLIDDKLVLKDNNYQENLVLNHSNISKNSKNIKNKSINELDNLENLDFEVSNISPKNLFKIENNPNETNNAAKSKNQTFILKNNLILEENNKHKFNSSLKKEKLNVFKNNDDINNKENKENSSLNLFENYVNSYEFLFDSFCQIEFLKTLLFDEHLYLNFKDLSKLYISINSTDKDKYLDEIRNKFYNDIKELSKNLINNDIIEKDCVIEKILKKKIFQY